MGKSFSYKTNTNRLLNHDDRTDVYSYDAHGNTTAMPHLPALVWDYKDQLKEADLGGGGDAYYVYDASGERIRKVIEKGTVVEERIYLGDYEVYTKTTSGVENTRRETLHISDGSKRIAIIDSEPGSTGGIVETNDSITIRYQYDNHLGSACLELDENAAIISYEEYHPFGTTSYRSGRSETEVSLKRYKYVGKERDEETGLYYYGARYFAGWIGRFVSVDPLAGKYPFYTPYQYSGNNPVTFYDLDGNETTENEVTNVETNGQQAPEFMMYETAKHGGMIPDDAKAGKMADNEVGNYTITPYYQKVEEGGWSLSHYTAGRDVPVGQDGDSYFREEWIISPSGLDEFTSKEERWWIPLQRPSGVANVVYAGGFEDFEKDLQLGNYGKGILGYGKAQWTNPEKLVAGATIGVMGIEAYHRGKIPGNIHEGSQGKHIEGHNNYVEDLGRSVLTEDAQTLLNQFKKGKGQIIDMPKEGQITIDFRKNIGDFFNSERKYVGPTTRGSIRYKTGQKKHLGSHIVPQKPK
jgi:RHS repeat-associated protein